MLRPRFPFNPQSLPGLKLWLDSSQSTLIRAAGQASQFTAATSEYLSIADNASLSTGDIDFMFAEWVYMDTKTTYRLVIDKENTNQNEYLLNYDVDIDRFRFRISSNGTAWTETVNADALGSPSTATWYFIVVWHDSVANTINIQVNDGTVDSFAASNGVRDGTASFTIGTNGDLAGAFMDGRMQCVGFWKSVLTATQRTTLYNGGTPLAYDQLDPDVKDAASLISYWEDPTREDLHGTNDLTNNNTVTQAAGTVLNAVTTWTDLAGQQGGNITQATQANKPVIRGAVGRTTLDSVSTSIPFRRNLRFDGVDDILSGGDILRVTSQITMFVVYSADNVTSLQFIVGKGLGGNYYSSYLGFIQTSNFKFTMATNSTPNAENIVASGTTLVNNTAFIGTCRYDGALQEIWTNGAGYNSSANTNGFFYSTDNFAIGGSGAGTPASFMTGRIAEVILYDRALNNAERNRVERFLSSKYNIALG